MSASHDAARKHLRAVKTDLTDAAIAEKLAPKFHPGAARVPGATQTTPAVVERRWALLPHAPSAKAEIADPQSLEKHALFERNIENYIGTVKLPVGLAGPIRVNGIAAQGDYYVPMATTEAALVASYHRGASVITLAGGATTLVLNEGVGRAPAFAFASLHQSGLFVQWCLGEVEAFAKAANATTRHGRFREAKFTVEGNHVYVLLEYVTGDASGQNMVTIATQAICDYILEHSPVKPEYFFVEGNLSGDKKASAQSFQSVRGKKVSAEVRLPAKLVERHLHTTVERMVDYWRMSALGGVLSGTIGVQGHYANGLAAVFIACGQDAASVSEAAVGVTRFEVGPEKELYASVTLPNVIVGTVGGGTGLPSQKACLEVLGLAGEGKARAFAEICTAVALAGELSIIAALSAHQFSQAHARLARGRKPTTDRTPKSE